MATNTGEGFRRGSVDNRSQTYNPKMIRMLNEIQQQGVLWMLSKVKSLKVLLKSLMVEKNNLSGDKMKTIFLQVLVYMILGVSHLFAEEINKANVMFTYKFFYNNQIIQEGFLA